MNLPKFYLPSRYYPAAATVVNGRVRKRQLKELLEVCHRMSPFQGVCQNRASSMVLYSWTICFLFNGLCVVNSVLPSIQDDETACQSREEGEDKMATPTVTIRSVVPALSNVYE